MVYSTARRTVVYRLYICTGCKCDIVKKNEGGFHITRMSHYTGQGTERSAGVVEVCFSGSTEEFQGLPGPGNI